MFFQALKLLKLILGSIISMFKELIIDIVDKPDSNEVSWPNIFIFKQFQLQMNNYISHRSDQSLFFMILSKISNPNSNKDSDFSLKIIINVF
jgi:hypothetical protein